MKRFAVVMLTVVMAGCATTNHLETTSLEGSAMRVDVRGETVAAVDADYHVRVSSDDPIGTMISVGTSIAKASQVEQVRERLDRATADLDLAGVIEDRLDAYFADEFGTVPVATSSSADAILVVDVREYGISAESWNAAVQMHIEVVCELFDADRGQRVWRRRVSTSRDASPAIFGLPGAAGNVVSAGVLSELSEEEIAYGMERLSREIALEIAYEFEDAWYRARF